ETHSRRGVRAPPPWCRTSSRARAPPRGRQRTVRLNSQQAALQTEPSIPVSEPFSYGTLPPSSIPGLSADQCLALPYVRASGPDTLKGDINWGSCSRKRPRSSGGATGCAQPRNESEIGGQPEAKLAQRPGHLRLDRLDRETQPIRDLA